MSMRADKSVRLLDNASLSAISAHTQDILDIQDGPHAVQVLSASRVRFFSIGIILALIEVIVLAGMYQIFPTYHLAASLCLFLLNASIGFLYCLALLHRDALTFMLVKLERRAIYLSLIQHAENGSYVKSDDDDVEDACDRIKLHIDALWENQHAGNEFGLDSKLNSTQEVRKQFSSGIKGALAFLFFNFMACEIAGLLEPAIPWLSHAFP